MATVELESFVTKFKHLCSVGINASLNFQCNQGETTVTLQANIGHFGVPCSGKSNGRPKSPAYVRRQIRRKASREAEQVSEVTTNAKTEKSTADEVAESIVFKNEAEKPVVKGVAEKPVIEDMDVDIKEKPADEVSCLDSSDQNSTGESQKFECEDCDFITCSAIKLKIHRKCAHAEMKNSCRGLAENIIKEKYENSKFYWETGRVGISYQTYVEALYLIEACLPRYEQIIKKDLLLETRKKQFGIDYSNYPPWCNK